MANSRSNEGSSIVHIGRNNSVQIENVEISAPAGWAGVEIAEDAGPSKIDNLRVSGGATPVRYLGNATQTSNYPPVSSASKSTIGWSRAIDDHPLFKKPDLADAKIKLDRARQYIADIESRIISFSATDFYRIRLQPDQGEGRIEIIFDSLHDPDKELSALIGDAIGNLRSVLDYIVTAYAGPHSSKPNQLGFPNADNAKSFASEVRADRAFGLCDSKVQDFFIEEVQAYKGGKGEIFWAVNKLRNIDKHRLLLTAMHIASITLSWCDKSGSAFKDITLKVQAGQSGPFVDTPEGHINITDNPRGSFEVLLHEPPNVESVPVLDLLNSAASATERLLDKL